MVVSTVLEARGLHKRFGDIEAVRGVDLMIAEGETYGLLGPNGAGKTTTILMLLGIERPTRGRVHLFGQDLGSDYFAIKRRIGVVAEHQYLYDDMTAREYLRFFADLYHVDGADHRIEELLEAVDLRPFADVPARDYSRGMKQKLGLVRALIHDPDLLILDEPVSGLDPYGIVQVRTLIQEQNSQGKTVFISSHILSEVEHTAHRVGIINICELKAEDTMA
jgi:ABC-2 type transport system ATP-binding protein